MLTGIAVLLIWLDALIRTMPHYELDLKLLFPSGSTLNRIRRAMPARSVSLFVSFYSECAQQQILSTKSHFFCIQNENIEDDDVGSDDNADESDVYEDMPDLIDDSELKVTHPASHTHPMRLHPTHRISPPSKQITPPHTHTHTHTI